MPTVAVNINVSTIGLDAGPFTISDNVLGVLVTGVPRTSLLANYVVNADDTATQITITSTGNCTNAITIPIDFHPCGSPTPPPPPPPPTPPTPPPPPPPGPPSPGTSTWTIRNADCGFGVIYDVGINGNFIGSLEGPSNFPLSSTLYGTKTNPSGIVYNSSSNTIQVNVSTNLPGSGNCGYLYIYVNGNAFPAYSIQFTSSPYVSISGVYIGDSDAIEVAVNCYPGCAIP